MIAPIKFKRIIYLLSWSIVGMMLFFVPIAISLSQLGEVITSLYTVPFSITVLVIFTIVSNKWVLRHVFK